MGYYIFKKDLWDIMNYRFLNKLIYVIFLCFYLTVDITNYLFSNNFFTVMIFYLFYILFLYYLINSFLSLLNSGFNVRNNISNLIILFFLYIIIFYERDFISFFSADIKRTLVIVTILLKYLFDFIFRNSDEILVKNFYYQSIFDNPAKFLVSLYFITALAGSVLLMLPISVYGDTLKMIDAVFTATSALSVTGLIVVDTATKFTPFGQVIILLLIQAGGLGIMILSYFIAFLVGKSLSIDDKIALSYSMSEDDKSLLSNNIVRIVTMTFIIEIMGAVILFAGFYGNYGAGFNTFFLSIFHSISAFCNAGFSLFSDSLMGYSNHSTIVLTVALLIIFGSIGFGVLNDLFNYIRYRIIPLFSQRIEKKLYYLSANTKLVLIISMTLIIMGTLSFYIIEHKFSILLFGIKKQYLIAFFQSVTLRTAGFNTVDISILQNSTLLFMIIFMFIGGASGSTAGGIKVNTLGVLLAGFRAFYKEDHVPVVFNKTISLKIFYDAFMIFFIALFILFTAVFMLTFTEDFTFIQILFEAVSAFGTVGLSTGITDKLTDSGKFIIIVLMFIGKLGPLTLLASVSKPSEPTNVRYPDARIQVG